MSNSPPLVTSQTTVFVVTLLPAPGAEDSGDEVVLERIAGAGVEVAVTIADARVERTGHDHGAVILE